MKKVLWWVFKDEATLRHTECGKMVDRIEHPWWLDTWYKPMSPTATQLLVSVLRKRITEADSFTLLAYSEPVFLARVLAALVTTFKHRTPP